MHRPNTIRLLEKNNDESQLRYQSSNDVLKDEMDNNQSHKEKLLENVSLVAATVEEKNVHGKKDEPHKGSNVLEEVTQITTDLSKCDIQKGSSGKSSNLRTKPVLLRKTESVPIKHGTTTKQQVSPQVRVYHVLSKWYSTNTAMFFNRSRHGNVENKVNFSDTHLIESFSSSSPSSGEREPALPLVDSTSQMVIRQRLVLQKL